MNCLIMKEMNYKKLYLIAFLLLPLASIQAQDFDEEFLTSLPEDVKEDLLKRNSDKEKLEECQKIYANFEATIKKAGCKCKHKGIQDKFAHQFKKLMNKK